MDNVYNVYKIKSSIRDSILLTWHINYIKVRLENSIYFAAMKKTLWYAMFRDIDRKDSLTVVTMTTLIIHRKYFHNHLTTFMYQAQLVKLRQIDCINIKNRKIQTRVYIQHLIKSEYWPFNKIQYWRQYTKHSMSLIILQGQQSHIALPHSFNTRKFIINLWKTMIPNQIYLCELLVLFVLILNTKQ